MNVLAVAEKCLHSTKTFSVSRLPFKLSRLGWTEVGRGYSWDGLLVFTTGVFYTM